MDLGLSNKVAVITGGSAGIGLAVAEGLAAEGVDVIIAAREPERVEAAALAIHRRYAVRTLGIPCDVGTREGTDALIAATEAFGGVDILINNAGTGSNETIMEAPDEKWQSYWDLHVMASVRLARGLVPGMRRRGGGVILHNASICAAQPLWYEPIYNVTKSALMMFSKTLAGEVIGDNSRRTGSRPRSSSPPRPAATGRATSTASRASTRRSSASARRRNWPMSSFSCARRKPAMPWGRLISSTAAC